MKLTICGLHTQFRRDLEFRSSLISYTAAVLLALPSAYFQFNVQFSMFVTTCTLTFIASNLYNYRSIYTIQAAFLGWVTGTSITLSCLSYGSLLPFFLRYVFILAVFHFSEFAFTAITNRRSLRPDSFLLNHSKEYWVAAVLSWAEFLFECHFLPTTKIWWISYFGFLLCIVGEVVRKMAMVHAGLGFTHKLATSKRPDHRLVTNGIYAYVRHPGYVGWMLWSVGTQMTLCNPVCFVVYAVVSWKFMDNRIYDEEKDLIAFFGDQYIQYQQRTWSGIPFSPGYIL